MPTAAPITDNATDNVMPIDAHMYGDVSIRNHATLTRSPFPVNTWYNIRTVDTDTTKPTNVELNTFRIILAFFFFNGLIGEFLNLNSVKLKIYRDKNEKNIHIIEQLIGLKFME